MIECSSAGRTLPDAYHLALQALHQYGVSIPCPDWKDSQKEVSMTMVIEEPLAEPMISRLFIGGPDELEQYTQEMLDGILDFEVLRGNWEYTYHLRMEKQIPWIIEELRREPYSRRATIMIGSPYDHLLESPACLQTIQYLIRDDKLHCKVLFRSNDAAKATFMNAYALIRLQERIAKTLGVGMGSYTHRANSFHCYGRDYKMLDGYVRRLESGSEVTYNYEGDWDERMEAAKPAIAEKVRKLREEHDLGRLEGLVKG